MGGTGGPKAVVDKTPVDQEEKRAKKHSEHPANSSLVRSEQDQGMPRRSYSGRRVTKFSAPPRHRGCRRFYHGVLVAAFEQATYRNTVKTGGKGKSPPQTSGVWDVRGFKGCHRVEEPLGFQDFQPPPTKEIPILWLCLLPRSIFEVWTFPLKVRSFPNRKWLPCLGERFCAPCTRKPPKKPSKNLLGTRLGSLCVQGALNCPTIAWRSRELLSIFSVTVPRDLAMKARGDFWVSFIFCGLRLPGSFARGNADASRPAPQPQHRPDMCPPPQVEKATAHTKGAQPCGHYRSGRN